MSIELNPVKPQRILTELLNLEKDNDKYGTLQENYLKKMRKEEPIEEIDLEDPLIFLKLFVFIYASPAIFQKLNESFIIYDFKYGPELVAILYLGLQKLLKNK